MSCIMRVTCLDPLLILCPWFAAFSLQTCRLAMELPHETNRNWRGNPSLLIRYVHPREAADPASPPVVSTLQIDVGKTFLTAVLRWYPHYGVRTLDGVLITHDHADAMLGLDDLRSVQRFELGPDGAELPPPRLPVHVSVRTLETVRRQFGYLVSAPAPLVGVEAIERKVAQLSFPVMRPFQRVVVGGLEIMPLPVLHGEDYVSFAFLFGTDLGRGECEACLYISDATRIPAVTWNYLCTGAIPTPTADDDVDTTNDASLADFYERFNHAVAHPLPTGERWSPLPALPSSIGPSGPRITLLVIDALFPTASHNTHFSRAHALAVIDRIRPQRAIITGMSDMWEYHRDNDDMRRRRDAGEIHVDVELAYDGLRVPIRL